MKKTKIVFRVDGYPKLGMGHVIRCIALAQRFQEIPNIEIGFITKYYTETVKKFSEIKYNVKTMPNNLDEKGEINFLLKMLKRMNVDIIITDLPYISDKYLKKLKTTKKLLVSIDDIGLKNFSSDVVISGYLSSKLKTYDLLTRNVKLYLGPKYLMLRKEFENANKKIRVIKDYADSVLITLGWADPENLTSKVVMALNMISKKLKITLILGSAYQYNNKLKTSLENSKQEFSVKTNVEMMEELMLNTDIAITAGGETSYELAATGTPAINISHLEHQSINANEMEKEGVLINLGVGKNVSVEEIRRNIEYLLKNKRLRKRMSERGKRLVDGKGAKRVANVVLNAFRNN